MPPRNVAPPVIAPRRNGCPRPVSSPVSERPSEKPMLIPAPTAAARPTIRVVCGSRVANAVANSGASVETEPSISPASAGCTTRSRNACSSCSLGTSPISSAMSAAERGGADGTDGPPGGARAPDRTRRRRGNGRSTRLVNRGYHQRPGVAARDATAYDAAVRVVAVETIHADAFPPLCYLRLHTDEGPVGLGETFWGPATVAAHVHEELAPALLGQDPLLIERHRLRLTRRGLRDLGAEGRALSALDLALWDLFGQATGRPVHALLGGAVRERIRVYNTCAGYEASDWRVGGPTEGPYE